MYFQSALDSSLLITSMARHPAMASKDNRILSFGTGLIDRNVEHVQTCADAGLYRKGWN